MKPQKPGNSPGPGPEAAERPTVAKERAAQRIRSWTVQNEMRGVLGRVSTGAAGRILDSVNPREKRTQQKTTSAAAKMRKSTASTTRVHKPPSGNRWILHVEEFR